jgi:hypothetical protein
MSGSTWAWATDEFGPVTVKKWVYEALDGHTTVWSFAGIASGSITGAGFTSTSQCMLEGAPTTGKVTWQWGSGIPVPSRRDGNDPIRAGSTSLSSSGLAKRGEVNSGGRSAT